MKESLWRLYGGLYTFVSTTRCLSRPLYLNRADDNIFRIIVYADLKDKPFNLAESLSSEGMLSLFSLKVMPYLNPVFRIISDKIFFGTLEYLRWVPNDFLQPKVRSLFAFIRNTGGKIVTFSEDVNKTPKVTWSVRIMLSPSHTRKLCQSAVWSCELHQVWHSLWHGLWKLITDEGFTANGIEQSLNFPCELTKVELHYVANWNFTLVVKWYRLSFFQTFPFRFLVG